MRGLVFFVSFVLSFVVFNTAWAQIINFPDPNFKNALVNTKCVDTNGDGYGDVDVDINNNGEIEISEAEKVVSLNIYKMDVSSIEGIQYFTSLRILDCQYNKLSEIKSEYLPLLVELKCNDNQNLKPLNYNHIPKLEILYVGNNNMTNFEISNLLFLSEIRINDKQTINSLGLSNLPSLKEIYCASSNIAEFNITDLPLLSKIDISRNKNFTNVVLFNLPSLTNFISRSTNNNIYFQFKDLPSLVEITCQGHTMLESVIFENLPKLEFIDCSATSIKTLELKNLPSLFSFFCGRNKNLKTLKLENLPKLRTLGCDESDLSIIELADLPSFANLYCNDIESLTKIIYENVPKLGVIECRNSSLSDIELKNLQLLTTIDFSGTSELKSLKLINLPSLTHLTCHNTNIDTLELIDFWNLNELRCGENSSLKKLTLFNLPKLHLLDFTSTKVVCIDFNNVSYLKSINFNQNDSLKYVKLESLSSLESLSCSGTSISELDLGYFPNLKEVYCSKCKSLVSLRLKNLPKIETLSCSNSSIVSILITNEGKFNNLNFSNCNELKYICCSPENIQKFEDKILYYQLNNVNVNSYCQFDPFGDFGIVKGDFVFDINNSDCLTSTNIVSNIQLNLSNTSDFGTYVFNSTKGYQLSILPGQNLITPFINSYLFNISPSNYSFIINNGDTIIQNFCLTPKEPFRHIDITIIPLSPPARPGFDAQYKIIWENKGNLLENGTLHFAYDENIFDYVKATLNPDVITSGRLSWDYTDLLPFEKREITVTLNLNSPVENPPVNAGDVTQLHAYILDNIFTLENTIVGSYDPNDKTCLQGNYFHPDSVGKYVDFLIRFENTGNYAAENIVVKDIIDDKVFDVSSLVITDASHEMYTRIAANKVEFIFEDIQLPFEDEHNDGYVAFKIKTKSTLVLGDSLKNLADIYFDYNFPIRTNETQTTIAIPTKTKDEIIDVMIYPNPVRDILFLEGDVRWQKAEIYDLTGRLIRVNYPDNTSLDVSAMQDGTYLLKLSSTDKSGWVKFVKM